MVVGLVVCCQPDGINFLPTGKHHRQPRQAHGRLFKSYSFLYRSNRMDAVSRPIGESNWLDPWLNA